MKGLIGLLCFVLFLTALVLLVRFISKKAGKRRSKWYSSVSDRLKLEFMEPKQKGQKHLAQGTVSGVPIIIHDELSSTQKMLVFSITIPAESFNYNFSIGTKSFTTKLTNTVNRNLLSVNNEFDKVYTALSDDADSFLRELNPLLQEKLLSSQNKMKNSRIIGGRNQIAFKRQLISNKDMYPPIEDIVEIVDLLVSMRNGK